MRTVFVLCAQVQYHIQYSEATCVLWRLCLSVIAVLILRVDIAFSSKPSPTVRITGGVNNGGCAGAVCVMPRKRSTAACDGSSAVRADLSKKEKKRGRLSGERQSNHAEAKQLRDEEGDEDESLEGENYDHEEEEEEEVTMDRDGRVAFEGRIDFGFCSYISAVDVQGHKKMSDLLIADCEAAFIEGGISFWVGADQSGRCGLEELALLIFKHHTRHADFDAKRSGVEWWVQVRRGDDGTRALRSRVAGRSIGMHWDKDEDLVDAQVLASARFLHRVSRMLSLADLPPRAPSGRGSTSTRTSPPSHTCQAPARRPWSWTSVVPPSTPRYSYAPAASITVTPVCLVIHPSSRPPDPLDYRLLAPSRVHHLCDADVTRRPCAPIVATRVQVAQVFGPIAQGWLSLPAAGKHVSFDGALLHGAPDDLAPLAPSALRLTFLANVWLNYRPSSLEVGARLT